MISFHRDGGPEGCRTVVTGTTGPKRGRRVVRGREDECCSSGLGEAALRRAGTLAGTLKEPT